MPETGRGPQKSPLMLYGIVFLAGAVLMSLEMIGSRLLAPTFGSSIYIWGALITTVMAALALGYYLGGKTADRRPGFAVMGGVLAAAGLFVGFLPLWTMPANHWFSAMGPRTGSLLASLAFFFLPSVLLAMISPYGIKLASKSLTTVGHTAGRLSAISSGGSIIGTLITSFYLIPALGVRGIVHTLGMILLLMAATAFITARRHQAAKTAVLPLFLALGCLLALGAVALSWRLVAVVDSPHPPGTVKMLYAGDSLYHHITVDEEADERHLHFDNSFQSALFPQEPLRMVFSYTSYLHVAIAAHARPERALFIGLGGGSAPAKFLHDYNTLTSVDIVEIDPAVASVAKKYFMLPDDPRLHLHVQDGRLFVENAAARIAAGQAPPYDLIVIDAFNADAIPYHLTTREFLGKVRACLSPDGVVAVNIIGCLDGERGRLLCAMYRTYADVFPQAYLFPIGGVSESWEDLFPHNTILLATLSPQRLRRGDWEARATALFASGWIKEDVPYYASLVVDDTRLKKSLAQHRDPVLTDDFAPVDTLQHGL